ncbi:MAG: hypothetical protein K0U93_26125, partial [Gammaproteobacteria bacterium]|nr:hypothetical protein [Gammaproteobacteria bacterium]
GYLVGIDTRLTPELEREGLARELSRTGNEARKQAGLEVSDRIVLRVGGSEEVEQAVDQYREYLMAETLASEWGGDEFVAEFTSEQHSLDAHTWRIELSRA